MGFMQLLDKSEVKGYISQLFEIGGVKVSTGRKGRTVSVSWCSGSHVNQSETKFNCR